MERSIKKFLEFNGKNVYFLSINGTYWIAVKPICEVLNVNYDRQFKNLKSDNVFSQLYAIQHIVASDLKSRKMVCLPEKFIYGWLFSINSESKELQEYKLKCYDILYDYFHGSLTNRPNILKEKIDTDKKIQSLEESLNENTNFQDLKKLLEHKKLLGKSLVQMDKDIITQQMDIWDMNQSTKI